MTHDEFLEAEFQKMALPDEQVISTAFGWTGPGILFQAMLLGPLFSHFLMKYHYAILTNQRLVLIKTKMSLTRLNQENLGVESIAGGNLKSVELKGGIIQRRLILTPGRGEPITFRINTAARIVDGQKEFAALAERELNRQIAGGVQTDFTGSPQYNTPAVEGGAPGPSPARWVFPLLPVLSVVLFGLVAILGAGEDELVMASYFAIPMGVAGIAGWVISKRNSSFARSSLISAALGLAGAGVLIVFYEAIWPSL